MTEQAVDEVDLGSGLSRLGGDSQVEIADPCVQLLSEGQVLIAATSGADTSSFLFILASLT